MPVSEKPLLQRVIEMAKQLPFVDEVMVATTILEKDGPIALLARECGVQSCRGDAINLLQRFADASADMKEKDNIIRITADNPFNWVEISQSLYEVHEDNGNDYTCIDGLSKIVCEVIRVRALRDVAIKEDLDPFDKEHVTPYFRKHKESFKIKFLPADFQGLGMT